MNKHRTNDFICITETGQENKTSNNKYYREFRKKRDEWSAIFDINPA